MFRRIREFFLLTDFWRGVLIVVPTILIVVIVALMIYWDHEPEPLDVRAVAAAKAAARGQAVVSGTTTTATLIAVAETLLNKRGGYLSNDMLPPGILMDNVPSWEFGVVLQIRDLADALRIHMSRSQTQSREDPDLAEAAPQFQFTNDSWILPSTESQYRNGIAHLESYLTRLGNDDPNDGSFYVRADNLREWLTRVQARLGNQATALAASVGDSKLQAMLGGSPRRDAQGEGREEPEKTPRLMVDNVFYEARGGCWALLHFLRAAQIDFADVLANKNAEESMENVIRSLEPTQDMIWSPIILNGTGFGFTANHSLVMGSYISRANAAVIELRNLLSEG